MAEYNDDYPTCASTYATLRIYPGGISLDEITAILRLPPSFAQTAETRPPGVKNKPSGWFLSSKGSVESKDVRRHLDWLLDQIADKASIFDALRNDGVRSDISCCWISARGHGGPSLWPRQMAILGSLGLEIWFDVYPTDG